MVRTRFAPSPTGYLHIGGLRTALYTWLFARKNGGKFILRIEDTDVERTVDGAIDVIYNTLRETGLLWDEGPDIGGPYGPYIQTKRWHTYRECAHRLMDSGGAYRCFCTKDQLDERRAAAEARGETFKYDKHCLRLSEREIAEKLVRGEPFVIRQNIPEQGTIAFDDLLYGHIEVDVSTLDDNVLIKGDGLPTYNFANVVDDHAMEITHVLRGSEYLSSTPKYNLLYESFGWDIPTYIHLPPVMRDASHKLSKRDGDASYDDFIKKGYLGEAVLNYVALLGWNSGTNQEKFTLDELIGAFGVEGLSKSPAIFDVAKLTWLNGEYIRAMTGNEFRQAALPWYRAAGVDGCDLDILDRILQPRLEIFSQIEEITDFLREDLPYGAELFENKKMKTDAALAEAVLGEVAPLLEAQTDWGEAALHDLLIGHAQSTGRKNGQVLYPLRIALTGKAVTPGGAIEAAALLGRARSLSRIKAAQSLLEAALRA